MTDSRKSPWRTAALLLILASALVCWSCSTDSGSPFVTDKSKWKLTLDVDGSEVSWPVEMMNIFWTDTEDEDHPDILEIYGEGMTLVGHLPKSWDSCGNEDEKIKEGAPLVGKTIDIEEEFPEDERYHFLQSGGESFLEVPGSGRWKVLSSSFSPEKHSGSRMGSEGDYTLTGRVSLSVEAPDGPRNLTGTLSAHCVCWF